MIESVNNEKIKRYAKLDEKKYRNLEHMFIVEGEHLVEEARKKGLIVEIFATVPYDGATLVSDAVMKKLSHLTNPPKVLAVVRMMKNREIAGNILILDGIQDPGNLGTIIRSAVAFGIDTIVMSDDTVDLYNTKTIRSSEGMLFNINFIKDDIRKIISDIKDRYLILTTNVNNGSNIKDIIINKPYAIIMGNEGNGVKDEIASLSNETIYIPMNNKCESLNAAIATSIILYELYQKDL